MILAAALLIGLAIGAAAQNRSIDFEETKVWKEIVDKAKKENKLIFVDCYTDWCGPCRQLAANVFTKDEVADFFNAKFVNAKFEMEKDEDGVTLKEQWQIRAFPTLVFYDPATDQVVHRLVGAGQPSWLIDGAKVAMDPENNLSSMIERYTKGNRDQEFMARYLKALKAAYMNDEQARVATEYLENLDADRLATAENWLLMRDNITDPLSKPMRTMMANRQKFYDIDGVGQEYVDRYLSSNILSAATALARWSPDYGPAFNQRRYDEMVKYLAGIDFPVQTAIIWLETSEILRNGNWDGLLARMRKIENDGLLPAVQYSQYYQFFIESLGRSGDKSIVAKGVKWLDEKIAAVEGTDSNAYFEKAGYAESKYRLYNAIGDELAADKAKMDKEEYEKEGQAVSGGRMQRAIRMS